MEQEKIVWWEMEGMVRMVCTVTEKNLPRLIVVVVTSELKQSRLCEKLFFSLYN